MKTILVDAVYTFIIETEGGFAIFEEMHALLDNYPNQKIILTNAPDERYKMYGLDAMPYEVFSLKNDPPKTDPKYYETMLAHFGLTSLDVIYFEHNPQAVESAESVGIKTHRYDPEKKDLTALKKFLDENL